MSKKIYNNILYCIVYKHTRVHDRVRRPRWYTTLQRGKRRNDFFFRFYYPPHSSDPPTHLNVAYTFLPYICRSRLTPPPVATRLSSYISLCNFFSYIIYPLVYLVLCVARYTAGKKNNILLLYTGCFANRAHPFFFFNNASYIDILKCTYKLNFWTIYWVYHSECTYFCDDKNFRF